MKCHAILDPETNTPPESETDRQENRHTAHEGEAPGLEPGVDEKKLCMNE
jgi:hypothetical protein